jgi:hypothetical protein
LQACVPRSTLKAGPILTNGRNSKENQVSKNLRVLCSIFAAVLVANGCSKDPVSPPSTPGAENTIGIDEDVIVSATGALAPAGSNANQHTFDLSGVSIVTSGAVDDFQVLYTTTTACDTDVNFFNVKTQQWDAVGINPGGSCFNVITDWERVISERDYNAANYISGSDELLIQSGVSPRIRVLELNPRFRAIPFLPDGVSARGIEIVGNVLWLAGRETLHRYTTSGTVQSDVPAGTRFWEGLAFDGQNFWVTNDGTVFSYSPQGALQCSFDTPGTAPTAMTYLDGRLWLAEGGELQKVNPVTSCLNNAVDIESSIQSTVNDVVGLATDGANFYIASSTNLVVMTISGAVLDTYPFQVENVSGIAYSDGGIWVVHRGPKGARSTGQFASRFLLP